MYIYYIYYENAFMFKYIIHIACMRVYYILLLLYLLYCSQCSFCLCLLSVSFSVSVYYLSLLYVSVYYLF